VIFFRLCFGIKKLFFLNRCFFVCTSCAFFFPVFFLFIVFPNIGVSDCDAEAYITGAISIRSGDGYVDRIGKPLNHWPPGYSYILSFFLSPLAASKLVNYMSFGFCSLFLYLISVSFKWPLVSSLFFAFLLDFGFFADLSLSAKPDIFCYSVFLFSALLFLQSNLLIKCLSLPLLGLLVLFKLVALSFIPGFVFGYFFFYHRKLSFDFFVIAFLGFFFWLCGLICVFAFNYYSVGVLSYSHQSPGVFSNLMVEISRFFLDVLRAGLVQWYGSIRSFPGFIFFLVAWVFCINALRTFRFLPVMNLAFMCGVGVFVFSWLMELFGSFYAGPRLMGYGMILMFFGFIPDKVWVWVFASIAVFVALIANATVGDRCGINNPVYNRIASEAKCFIMHDQLVYTNASNVLDVLVGIPTHFAANPKETPPGGLYFIIKRNEPDLMARPVVSVKVDVESNDWFVIHNDSNYCLLLRQ
jgi:hypothetical protein